MKDKISNNGLQQSHVSRIIKSLQITTIFFNCFGFSLLLIKAFFFPYHAYFLQILDETFTFLIVIESIYLSNLVILNLSIKYWMFRARRSPPSHSTSLHIRIIILGIIESFKNYWDLIHFLFIFVQPNILLPESVNHHLYSIAPIRVYTLIRFSLMMEFLLNPSFLRICKSFNKSKPKLALKMAYKKYFIVGVISFVGVIVVGFGNLMKDQEIQVFQDIYVAAYYIFVTISTVGYGDYVPTSTLTRVVSMVILILGVFIMSLLTYVVLKETKLGDQEGITYYQIKKLQVKGDAERFLRDRFVELIDESMKEEERKREERRVEEMEQAKEGFRKGGRDKRREYQIPVNTSKKNILDQQKQATNILPAQTKQEPTENNQHYQTLQKLAHDIKYLQMINPMRILTARHKLQRMKKKIVPISLTTLQFSDITKPKQYNIPGHRSFYTKQQF